MSMQTAWDLFAVQSNELLSVWANPVAWTFIAEVNTGSLQKHSYYTGWTVSYSPCCLQIFVKRLGKIFYIYISFGYKGKLYASHVIQ